MLVLFSVFAVAAAGNGEHVSFDPPNKYFINTVPFTRQLPNFCGPASLVSLLAYYDIPLTQKVIASCAYDSGKSGTNGADLLLYCREKGLSAYSFNSTLPELKKLIAKGYPVIVLQEWSKNNKTGHFRVAVGYNDSERTITLRDSMTPKLVKLSYTGFDNLWQRRGRWAMLAMPPKKDSFKDDFGTSNAVVHMDLAQAYLRRKDFKSAEQECRKALGIEPQNPFAHKLLTQAKSKA